MIRLIEITAFMELLQTKIERLTQEVISTTCVTRIVLTDRADHFVEISSWVVH